MSPRLSKGGCWPTRQQELLLEAAVLHGSRAEASWESLNAMATIDELGWTSSHLFPQIYRNLEALRIVTPEMDRLKGAYRYTWTRNTRLLQDLAPLLRTLQDAGIDLLMLKDVALATFYYRDYGRRSINEIHVLIRPSQALRALALLKEMGCQVPVGSKERLMTVRSCAPVQAGADQLLNLHWRMSGERNASNQGGTFWDAALHTEIGGVQTRVLCATDQLFDVCAQGLYWAVVPPTLWIVDAITILDSVESDVDWGRLTALAAEAQMTPLIRNTLKYIRDAFGAKVPDGVLQGLEANPPSRGERAEYEARIHQPAIRRKMRAYWYRYEELARGQSPWRRVTGFPGYLQRAWELEHLWQVLLYAGKLGTQQLSHAVRGKLSQ